ncbi:hypothetical protein R3P38DRAFT_2774360 [Favolaschia claudopus]|uniref:Uncharacterized protein n=1 Tax=Favolaschia claudopus TaxID=2862362 RepID=A0AAW0BY92_9AGAR
MEERRKNEQQVANNGQQRVQQARESKAFECKVWATSSYSAPIGAKLSREWTRNLSRVERLGQVESSRYLGGDIIVVGDNAALAVEPTIPFPRSLSSTNNDLLVNADVDDRRMITTFVTRVKENIYIVPKDTRNDALKGEHLGNAKRRPKWAPFGDRFRHTPGYTLREGEKLHYGQLVSGGNALEEVSANIENRAETDLRKDVDVDAEGLMQRRLMTRIHGAALIEDGVSEKRFLLLGWRKTAHLLTDRVAQPVPYAALDKNVDGRGNYLRESSLETMRGLNKKCTKTQFERATTTKMGRRRGGGGEPVIVGRWQRCAELSESSVRGGRRCIDSGGLPRPNYRSSHPTSSSSPPSPTLTQPTYVAGQPFTLPAPNPIPSSSFEYITAPSLLLLPSRLASNRATCSRSTVASVSREVRRQASSVCAVWFVDVGWGLQKSTPPRTTSEAAMLAPTEAAIAMTVVLLSLEPDAGTPRTVEVAVAINEDADAVDADETAEGGKEEALMKPERVPYPEEGAGLLDCALQELARAGEARVSARFVPVKEGVGESSSSVWRLVWRKIETKAKTGKEEMQRRRDGGETDTRGKRGEKKKKGIENRNSQSPNRTLVHKRLRVQPDHRAPIPALTAPATLSILAHRREAS